MTAIPFATSRGGQSVARIFRQEPFGYSGTHDDKTPVSFRRL